MGFIYHNYNYTTVMMFKTIKSNTVRLVIFRVEIFVVWKTQMILWIYSFVVYLFYSLVIYIAKIHNFSWIRQLNKMRKNLSRPSILGSVSDLYIFLPCRQRFQTFIKQPLSCLQCQFVLRRCGLESSQFCLCGIQDIRQSSIEEVLVLVTLLLELVR